MNLLLIRFFFINYDFMHWDRFAAINCGLVYLYSINFQKIDEEAYGGAWELMKEGFMTSFAGFLVTWIIFYTGLHIDNLSNAI